MSFERMQLITKYIIGWFLVCVFVGGAPRVISFAYYSIKGTYKTVKCELWVCDGSPLTRPTEEQVAAQLEKVKKGKFPELQDKDFAFLLAVKEVNR